MIHYISAERLTLERIGDILAGGYKLELSDDAKQRIRRCRTYLDRRISHSGEPIYGVTTGFGSLCNVSIGHDQLSQLQVNLIKSHACGVGNRVPADIVRLMLLLKIHMRILTLLTTSLKNIPKNWLTSACRCWGWARWNIKAR